MPSRNVIDEHPLATLLADLAATTDGTVGSAILGSYLVQDACALVLVHARRKGTLFLVAHAGVPAEATRSLATMSLHTRTPMSDALASGRDLLLTRDELTRAFPLAAPLGRSISGNSAFSVHRLRRAGAPVGTVTLGYRALPASTWGMGQRITALCNALALWISSETPEASPEIARPSEFTERQREIVALVSEGATNPRIAEELSVSVATVKAELASLFVLLGARRRQELPARAIRAGL
ncbi:MAG: response regulator transcription factor [Candidatus Nanopelagicales bacterium]